MQIEIKVLAFNSVSSDIVLCLAISLLSIAPQLAGVFRLCFYHQIRHSWVFQRSLTKYAIGALA